MDSIGLYNVLDGFDFRILNDSEFKEDSVREEVIIPILKGLGYSANKPYQIIRSRQLKHPFVSIGSIRKNISIIPDYIFEVEGKPAWILDAKAPTETIINSAHVEQAYSYAIHHDVRVKFFALCNGKEFALYDIENISPIMHFPIYAIPLYWAELKRIVAPNNVLLHQYHKLNKDFGLHLKRLGFDSFVNLIFPQVPVTNIGQLDQGMFSLASSITMEGDTYCASFDFGEGVFRQLVGKIPSSAIDILQNRTSNERHAVNFADKAFLVTIDCKIGEKLEENEQEIFLPFWINKFL